MSWLQMPIFQHTCGSPMPRRVDPGIQMALAALGLYRSALRGARLGKWYALLTRRPYTLLRLNQVDARGVAWRNHFVGVCTVPICEIRGSEGRSGDFDAKFRPLHDWTRGRWLSIATARLMGVTMPPVKLIQVGDTYYVRDGHHRISVARAMGQEWIEAEVAVWRLDASPSPALTAEASRLKAGVAEPATCVGVWSRGWDRCRGEPLLETDLRLASGSHRPSAGRP